MKRIRVTLQLDEDIVKALDHHAVDAGLARSDTVNMILRLHFQAPTAEAINDEDDIATLPASEPEYRPLTPSVWEGVDAAIAKIDREFGLEGNT